MKENKRIHQRELNIIAKDTLPEEVRSLALDLIHKFAFIFPNWIQVVHVDFLTDSKNNTAECWVGYNTRETVIYINGNFLCASEMDREIAIIHEIVHSVFQPAAVSVHRKLQEKEVVKTGEALPESIIDGVEQAVQDCAYSLYRCYYMERQKE